MTKIRAPDGTIYEVAVSHGGDEKYDFDPIEFLKAVYGGEPVEAWGQCLMDETYWCVTNNKESTVSLHVRLQPQASAKHGFGTVANIYIEVDRDKTEKSFDA